MGVLRDGREDGRDASGVVLNDVHTRLNPTRVREVVRPQSLPDIQHALRRAAREGLAVCLVGGRHAMGGQQFGSGAMALDLTGMRRVLGFDRERGLIEVEAGMQWPELIEYLRAQDPPRWGIRQKQTGVNRVTLGGSLASNGHGRGLRFKPLVGDVEGFTLVDAAGTVRRCDRREHAALFRLAIGGYGLFGVIASVRLRLARRVKLERVVEVLDVADLAAAFRQRAGAGYLYGDFQFSIDTGGDDFLRQGVFSCYRPVADETPIPAGQRRLSLEDWKALLYLAHTDKRQAVDRYTAHYLATCGQIYWSDTHQLAEYVEDYHLELDRRLGASAPASEIISELYVPREALAAFLAGAREDFRRHGVDVVYGTVRVIERDDESFLAWAREAYACVVFNLHTPHTAAGLAHSGDAFRRLIDLALQHRGSYFLTYHRFATRAQVEACYPQFPAFLRLKREYDPQERFQSEWYRHYRAMFSA